MALCERTWKLVSLRDVACHLPFSRPPGAEGWAGGFPATRRQVDREAQVPTGSTPGQSWHVRKLPMDPQQGEIPEEAQTEKVPQEDLGGHSCFEMCILN